MIKTLIVEDNPKSAEFLKEYLHNLFSDLEVVGIANTVAEAIEFIFNEKPNLIFLDINLGDESGFEIFDKTNAEKFVVVVTSAYSEYALKAIDNSVIGYILKPYDAHELIKAVNKAKKQITLIENKSSPNQNKISDRIYISTLDGLIFIEIQSIVCIKADSNYSEFYLVDGSKLVSSKRLAIYEEMLKNYSFVRVHRSYIVNLKHVKRYQRGRSGNLYMSNGSIIKVSETNKDELLSLMMH